MYKWSRSAVIAEGRAPEAVEFAGAIVASISERYVPVQVGMEMAGQWGRIHWFSDPDSAAHWEDINLELHGDEEHQALIVGAGDLFIAGQTKDTLVMLLRGSETRPAGSPPHLEVGSTTRRNRTMSLLRLSGMRLPALLLIALAIVASGCGGGSDLGPGTSSTMSPTVSTTTETTPIPAIMAAALTQLVTVDTTFAPGHRFTQLLVQSHVDPKAGTATGGPERGRALTSSEREAIETALTEVAPVRWIDDPNDWRTDDLEPVVEGAAIVGVGEPEFTGADALVPVSLWCGGLCGTWFTYRVATVDDAWEVVGIEGPISIS